MADKFSMKDYEGVKKKVFWSRFKRRVFKHVWLVRIVLLIFCVVIISTGLFFAYRAVRSSVVGVYVGLVRDFVVPTAAKVVTGDGRVNVLIVGKGGVGHDAPDLTDTMMVVSLSIPNRAVSLISIPRDIWVEDLKAKINASYYWGNKKQVGGGLVLAKSTIEEVVGVPVAYGVVVDFNAFKEVIDALGGIEVNVKAAFTDKQYPIAGRENDLCGGDRTYACRYMTVSFKAGPQIMNGDTALVFVRSRHGDNDEGDDVHREARQQLIVQAILEKTLTLEVLTSSTKLGALIKIAEDNIETDIKPTEAATIGRYLVNARNNMKSYGIPQDLLLNPTPTSKYLNQFVFIPKKGLADWSEVHKWVETVLP